MENFNTVPDKGTFGGSVEVINQNFSLAQQEMEILRNLISPDTKFVTAVATAQTTSVTQVLPETGSADTVYRVGSWDGSQYDPSVYSEYAWNGSAYIKLNTKSQAGEVYDISANHSGAKYADLAAALGTNGANIPQSLRKGGMSVKFVQSSDNKYVQYRLMSDSFNTTPANWQGVDDEPTAGSDNLVKSGGIANAIGTNDNPIDLSPYIANRHNGIISISTGGWSSVTSSYQHIIVPIIAGQKYKLKTEQSSAAYLVYAPLKSYSGTNTPPDYCSGWDKPAYAWQGNEVELTMPSDCTCLYLTYKDGGNIADLSVVLSGNIGKAFEALSLDDTTAVAEQAEQMDISLRKDVGTLETPNKKVLNVLTLPPASEEKAGLMTALDKTILLSIAGIPDKQIDLSPYIANRHNGIISISTGGWSSVTSSYQHIIVPVIAGQNYKLKANTGSPTYLVYAPLKSYSGTNTPPDYCSGWDKPAYAWQGNEVELTMPLDCTCLYLTYKDGGNIADLSVVLLGEDGEIQDIENQMILDNDWIGKKIAWYGTSIPAGADNTISISGNAINAVLHNGTVTRYEKGFNLPQEYPVIASSLLGADSIFNMAQGSSKIQRDTTNSNLRYRCLCLMNTALDNIEAIFGAYNIDTTNKTFSRNLNNTVGITEWFETGWESSWNIFAGHVIDMISQSHEIRLVAKFLVPQASSSSYITSILGAYYSQIETMLLDLGKTISDFAGHVADIDLVAIEHSVNDNVNISVPLDSEDERTFAGAYNKMFNIIRFYNPEMRVVVISNYMELTQYDIQGYLHRIAQYHNAPFMAMIDYSQVSNAKQITQGYWDASGNWHNTGFQWTEDEPNDSYTTNCTFPSAIRSTSLAQMKENINPHQVGGVWCWESANLYQWCADGLHPHSDKTGRLTILIGKTLAWWLKTIRKV